MTELLGRTLGRLMGFEEHLGHRAPAGDRDNRRPLRRRGGCYHRRIGGNHKKRTPAKLVSRCGIALRCQRFFLEELLHSDRGKASSRDGQWRMVLCASSLSTGKCHKKDLSRWEISISIAALPASHLQKYSDVAEPGGIERVPWVSLAQNTQTRTKKGVK